MATKDDTTKAAPAKVTPATAPKDTDTKATAAPAKKEEAPRVSTCVVNDGRGMHVGNAVNGEVCSYHAMHYDQNGNRR